MNKTKQKIILAAIELYNSEGMANTLNQGIADKSGISLSNFNYHFKTKKELILAVCEYMRITLDNRISESSILTSGGLILEAAKIYLDFQQEFKFFYRDTPHILKTYPTVKEGLIQQIEISLQVIQNLNYLSIGKGYMLAEPDDFEGLYDKLIEQIWMTIHFWTAQVGIRSVKGHEVQNGLESVYAVVYPYLTEKGKKAFQTFLAKHKTLSK